MAEHGAQKEVIIQNLKDAGCSNELIEHSIHLLNEGNAKEVRAVLAKHRKTLLENCHIEQKKIDCLDYLVYQLERKN